MSVIRTGPADLWVQKMSPEPGLPSHWEYLGTTEGSLNWVEKEKNTVTSQIFQPGDRVRLKDSIYEGKVTSSWSIVYFRTDAGIEFTVSNPDLLELVAPTALVGDVWRDENGSEWVILKGSNGLVARNVDVYSCANYFEHKEFGGAGRSLDKWYRNYKPTLVRRRGE